MNDHIIIIESNDNRELGEEKIKQYTREIRDLLNKLNITWREIYNNGIEESHVKNFTTFKRKIVK